MAVLLGGGTDRHDHRSAARKPLLRLRPSEVLKPDAGHVRDASPGSGARRRPRAAAPAGEEMTLPVGQPESRIDLRLMRAAGRHQGRGDFLCRADGEIVRCLDVEDRLRRRGSTRNHRSRQISIPVPVHRRTGELDATAEVRLLSAGEERVDTPEGASHRRHAGVIEPGQGPDMVERRQHIVALALKSGDELAVIGAGVKGSSGHSSRQLGPGEAP